MTDAGHVSSKENPQHVPVSYHTVQPLISVPFLCTLKDLDGEIVLVNFLFLFLETFLL